MEAIEFISAAAIAIAAVVLIALPLVAWRARLGFRNDYLALGIVSATALLFTIIAMRKRVRLSEVAERLAAPATDRERIATAVEFAGDSDVFKRLAVRQTEQWIESEGDRLSQTRLSRTPRYAVLALIAMILVWLLTPSLLRFPPGQVFAAAIPATRPSATSQPASQPASQPISSPVSAANGTNPSASSNTSVSGQQANQGGAGKAGGSKLAQSNGNGAASAGKSGSGAGSGQAKGNGKGSGTQAGSSGQNPGNANGNPGTSAAASVTPAGNQGKGASATSTGGSGADPNKGQVNGGQKGQPIEPGQSGTPKSAGANNPKGSGNPPAGTGTPGLSPSGGLKAAKGNSDETTPTGSIPQRPVHEIEASKARSSGTEKERESVGEIDPAIAHPAATAPGFDKDFVPVAPESAEMETLPPKRKQIVIEYFRLMRGDTSSSTTTQPTPGGNVP